MFYPWLEISPAFDLKPKVSPLVRSNVFVLGADLYIVYNIPIIYSPAVKEQNSDEDD
jgi:hypothetical protein